MYRIISRDVTAEIISFAALFLRDIAKTAAKEPKPKPRNGRYAQNIVCEVTWINVDGFHARLAKNAFVAEDFVRENWRRVQNALSILHCYFQRVNFTPVLE